MYKINKKFKPTWLFAQKIPDGFELLGLITRDGWDSGLLIQDQRTKIFMQLNHTSLRSLDQSVVKSILDCCAGLTKRDSA